MGSNREYSPTQGDVLSVLRLLHDNGINVQNSKKAYEELQQYEANPSFCILLSHVFGAEACPIQGLQLSGSWIQYRRLAGITLKNNLEKSRHALGLAAVREAARCTLAVLGNPSDARIARVAAQIVIKITALTSLEWWHECGMGSLPSLLLHELFGAGELRTLSALYSLQYLMEDLPKSVGAAGKDIIEQVLTLVLDQSAETSLRKAAFKMCFNIYEQAELLDWNVEGLSPLQCGLTAASGAFANACTTLLEQGCGNDITLWIQVLRSCVLMLEYFEYFTPMSDEDMSRFVNWWIRRTMDLIASGGVAGEYDVQLKIVAIDLLTAAMKLYDRMGGEGYVCLLVDPILQTLQVLVPALVNFVPMTLEEMDSVISNDDYRLRDTTSVNYHLSEKNRDISEDTFVDDDCGSATLRSSALRCIDTLCFFSSKQAFPYLIERVNTLWNVQQSREAAFVLVGTIANGCYSEIEPLLSGVVSQLVDATISQSEDIFVVSIAIWSLSRVLEWAYTQEGAVLDNILKAFIVRLQSTSKRVQQAAVSALNTAFAVSHNMGTRGKLAGMLPSLAESITACLPIYCDTNLSLLCDLALHLISAATDDSLILQLSTAFKENRAVRAKLFETSYVHAYINETPNAHVDKDVFSIDRVIVGFLTRFPESGVSLKILDAWLGALKDAVERDVGDDADLLYNMMRICCNLVSVTPTVDLTGWTCQTGHSLATLGFRLFAASPHHLVKSAAVSLLYHLLKVMGRCAFPDGLSPKLLAQLTSSVREVDDPYEKLELVRLIALMAQTHFSDLPNDTLGAFQAAVGALRSDAYSDSRWIFEQMAYDVCRTLEIVPSFIPQSRLHEIAQIMAQAENTYDKSVATIQWINALLLVEELALNVFPHAMRLLYSWQQAACNFPGTQEKLRSLLCFYGRKQNDMLQEYLNGLHPNFRELLLSTYGVNQQHSSNLKFGETSL